jgi:spermidine synthase
VHPIDFGTADIEPDPNRTGAWVLRIDGIAQSYVDLVDPRFLEFRYMRRIAAVLDTAAPGARPLRVLHLGGGAYSLPRYVAASRPGSAQVVVERDAALAALVERELPLPAGAGIDIVIGDARSTVEDAVPGRYDVVIGDVYDGARMAGSVATVEFVAAVAAALAGGGTYVVNVTDLPPLAFSKRQAATVRAAFPDVCVVAEPALLRGRRYGNTVIAGRLPPGGLPLTRLASRVDGAVLHGADLAGFVAGARPLTDAEVGSGQDFGIV